MRVKGKHDEIQMGDGEGEMREEGGRREGETDQTDTQAEGREGEQEEDDKREANIKNIKTTKDGKGEIIE